MTEWQRLEHIICWTGLSTNAFALGVGLKRSENLYQIKRGNNGISKELAELITSKYPTVNAAWLLTGYGDSFIDTGSTAAAIAPQPTLPVYSLDGAQLTMSDHPITTAPLYYISVPAFAECDFAVTTHGEAMSPDVPSGAVVALRAIQLERLIPGEIYMVVTRDFAALRYVRFNPSDSSQLLLTPTNRTAYDEMTLPRKAVMRIYLVKGIVISRVF